MRPIILLLLPFFFSGCETKNNTTKKRCITSKSVGIQFIRPFDYDTNDTLIIDDLRFTHVTYLDSLQLGNYLPSKKSVILEINGKQAIEDANEISIGRALARAILRSNNYKILNHPELMTTGKLRFLRKDGKEIQICVPKKYSVNLYYTNDYLTLHPIYK